MKAFSTKIILSSLLFFCFSTFGYSQGAPSSKKGKFTEHINAVVSNLTPDQKTKLDNLAVDFFQSTRPQRHALKEMREKIKQMEAQGKYDEKEMNALIDKIAVQQAEYDKQLMAFKKKIATILTKEQLDELKKAKSKYSN